MKMPFLNKLAKAFAFLAVFLIPFYIFRFSIFSIPTNIFELAVILLLLATSSSLLAAKSKLHLGSPWLILFLFSALISIFFAADKTQALGIFKGWFLVPAIFYLCLINLFSRETAKQLLWPLFASLFLVVAWSLLQAFGAIELLFYQKGDPGLATYLTLINFRLFGPFESPNYLAMYLVSTLFLSLPLLLEAKKKNLVAFILILSVLMLGAITLYFTASRAGMLAFAFGWFLIAVFKFKKEKLLALGAFLFSLIVFCSIFIGTNFGGRGESNASRIDIYNYSFQMVKEAPIFGIGLGEFHNRITNLSAGNDYFIQNTLSYALHPHNLLLALWLNLGILGLISFAGLTYFHLLKQQTTPMLCAPLAALSAILIHGLFDTTYFKNDLSAVFFLILAILFIFKYDKNTLKN
jgi:O-antigen ligase